MGRISEGCRLSRERHGCGGYLGVGTPISFTWTIWRRTALDYSSRLQVRPGRYRRQVEGRLLHRRQQTPDLGENQEPEIQSGGKAAGIVRAGLTTFPENAGLS